MDAEVDAAVLRANVARVQARIAAAAARAGRNPADVTLVAVSKTQPVEVILAAYAAGLRLFGENRVEEAGPKAAEVQARLAPAPPPVWHMIGHVQSRKARLVTRGYALLHSLDSVRLARRLDAYLSAQARALDVLLQVNVSGEATKEGWDAYQWDMRSTLRAALWRDVEAVLALPSLRVRGLMTMAPLAEEPETARPVFAALRALRDALREDFPRADWNELSMGMTDDYPIAIEEGATLVRIGRAIFGARQAR